jgi:hypothetical protein
MPSKLSKLQKLTEQIEKPRTKQDKFLDALEVMAEGVDTRASLDEMAQVIKTVASFARETRDLTAEELQRLNAAAEALLVKMEAQNTKSLSDLRNSLDDSVTKALMSIDKKLAESLSVVNNALEKQSDGMNFIHDKVSRLKSIKGEQGEPGLDADEEEVKADVLDTLNKELVEPLKKEMEEFKKTVKKQKGSGGGTSAIGVAQAFKHISHTEAPVGDIDGANVTYTVNNNIFWIAGFTINNLQIAELPNFTYVGKTITFGTALPAAYSGKDFEVKYIGT